MVLEGRDEIASVTLEVRVGGLVNSDRLAEEEEEGVAVEDDEDDDEDDGCFLDRPFSSISSSPRFRGGGTAEEKALRVTFLIVLWNDGFAAATAAWTSAAEEEEP